MTELRDRLIRFWDNAQGDVDARRMDSQSVVLELQRFYRDLSADERVAADRVLVEWILGDDSKRRFDGLAPVREFSIQAALPALRVLAERFAQASGPSAAYDLAKVNSIIEKLTPASSGM